MATPSHGQEYGFMNWSTSEGLAQSQVRVFYQDHLGYLWIGTLGGVSRFDGKDFQNYSKQDGLLNNQVNSIFQNAQNEMVFGSIGGLTVFNGQEFSKFPFPEEYQNAQVNHIAKANDQLLISTEIGLLSFDGEFQTIAQEWDEQKLHVKKSWLENGVVHLCAKRGLFQVIDGTTSALLISQDYGALFMDISKKEDHYLIATIGKGLLKWSGQEAHLSEHALLGFGTNFTGITNDVRGTWLKGRDGLFFISNSGEVQVYGEKEGLATSDVRAVITDREGNLWVGTNGAGIQKFPGNTFQTFTSEDEMSGKIVMDVLRDEKGTLWFSTYDNGISSFDEDGKWSYYDNSNAILRNTRIWCSEQRADGTLFFGSSGGLITNLESEVSYFTKQEGLPHNQVLSLKDHQGNLYIGTAKGLCKLNAEGEIEMHPASPQAKVRAIAFDEANNIWLATNRGVWMINSDTQVHYTESSGLADKSTYCLNIDPYNAVWVGTESGLTIIEGNEVKSISIPGGFGTNHVNFIEFDQKNTAWLGTNNGLLNSPNPKDKSQNFDWRRFGPHDGLKFLETNQNSALLENDKLFFGTNEAPVILELAELRSENTVPIPKVVISNLKINLNDPDWTKYNVQKFSYGKWPQPLEVPYEDHHFSFSFDALSLSYPDDVNYQYKLTGVDNDWQRATDVDFTTYGYLSHDDFVFEVRAIDTFGRVSEPATFSFSVLAPIWFRWWFIGLELLLICAIIFLIYRARRRVLINEMEKEKYEYKSKMLALEQQSLNSSMNRHFIFNALNSIQYYINRQDRLSANKYLSSFAKLIRKNLDSSQNNLTTLQEEIERLELYLQLESMRFQEKFDYSIDLDDELDPNAVKVPSMMLQPFLENSIWHGILPKEEPGNILVQIEKINGEKVLFSIKDNGIGIETSLKNKTEEPDHISKGMHITSGRIELIRKMTNQHVELIGPFEILDEQKKVLGTEVKIILPLEFDSFYTR